MLWDGHINEASWSLSQLIRQCCFCSGRVLLGQPVGHLVMLLDSMPCAMGAVILHQPAMCRLVSQCLSF